MSVIPRPEERPRTAGSGFALKRVKIRNYKSIGNCDVELGPFTLLVGRNGAGKSNFLNALRLVADGLSGSPNWASGSAYPWSGAADSWVLLEPVWVEFQMTLPSCGEATYGVQLGLRDIAGLTVEHESLEIRREDGTRSYYRCAKGHVRDASTTNLPPATDDRLYLTRASAVPEFRPVYDALSAMGFYNFDPEVMRGTQGEHAGLSLSHDGSNLASVLDYIEHVGPLGKEWITTWLGTIIPEFGDIKFQRFGPYTTLVFVRKDGGNGPANSFYAHGVSDGTLRALGILVAVNQLASDGSPIRLVGIEEPETALHPAAAGALMDALREASTHTQVLVTTHSADLLDRFDPETDGLLLATMSGGATHLSQIDSASRRIIRKHLDTAGGLLRMDQLEPDHADLERQRAEPSPLDTNGEA